MQNGYYYHHCGLHLIRLIRLRLSIFYHYLRMKYKDELSDSLSKSVYVCSGGGVCLKGVGEGGGGCPIQCSISRGAQFNS